MLHLLRHSVKCIWMSNVFLNTWRIASSSKFVPVCYFMNPVPARCLSIKSSLNVTSASPTPGGRPASPRKSSVPADSFSGGWWNIWGKFHRRAAARSGAVSQQVSCSYSFSHISTTWKSVCGPCIYASSFFFLFKSWCLVGGILSLENNKPSLQ